MEDIRERAETRFCRAELANQFCICAEAPVVLMGFFDGPTKSFTETWSGHPDSSSTECCQHIIRDSGAQLAEWVTLHAAGIGRDDSRNNSDVFAHLPMWIKANDLVVGIGSPVGGVFPVLALPASTQPDKIKLQPLLSMGLAYVAQQLTSKMYTRSVWMGHLVETAMQVLAIQFLVVTPEGEILSDSWRNQGQPTQPPDWLVRNDRLSTGSKAGRPELLEAVRAATSPEQGTSIVSVFVGSDVARFVVVTPLVGSGSRMALILFESDQVDHFNLREHFFDAYRLTRSEKTIAHEILSGRSVAETAAAKNLALTTVRSYMKQVFSKTGTHRQGELISLYFSSILPVTSDLRGVANASVH